MSGEITDKVRFVGLFVSLFLFRCEPSLAAELTGRASVIDGDTLEIHRTRIRLRGIFSTKAANLNRLTALLRKKRLWDSARQETAAPPPQLP